MIARIKNFLRTHTLRKEIIFLFSLLLIFLSFSCESVKFNKDLLAYVNSVEIYPELYKSDEPIYIYDTPSSRGGSYCRFL